MWEAKNPRRIKPNFLLLGVGDIITPLKFGDDRFRSFGFAEGQSLPFLIYFKDRPCNTHTILIGVMLRDSSSSHPFNYI